MLERKHCRGKGLCAGDDGKPPCEQGLGWEQGQQLGSLEGCAKGLKLFQVGTGRSCPVLFIGLCLSPQICFEDS